MDLCNYSGGYIVVKGTTTVKGIDNVSRRNKKLTLKQNNPLRSYISKINNTFVDNAEDLDIVIPIYNLLMPVQWQLIYDIRISLGNYYRNEVNDAAHENNNDDCKVNNSETTTSRSFE